MLNRLIIYLSRPILRNVALPKFMTKLADRTGSSQAKSNIIMLWQKESAPSDTDFLH